MYLSRSTPWLLSTDYCLLSSMLLLTALMLGCIHALEADHMLAVASFVTRKPSVEGAMRFGARWGFGHAMAVLAAGSVLLLLGVRMPARWDAFASGQRARVDCLGRFATTRRHSTRSTSSSKAQTSDRSSAPG